jgi:hypothetical protein
MKRTYAEEACLNCTTVLAHLAFPDSIISNIFEWSPSNFSAYDLFTHPCDECGELLPCRPFDNSAISIETLITQKADCISGGDLEDVIDDARSHLSMGSHTGDLLHHASAHWHRMESILERTFKTSGRFLLASEALCGHMCQKVTGDSCCYGQHKQVWTLAVNGTVVNVKRFDGFIKQRFNLDPKRDDLRTKIRFRDKYLETYDFIGNG